MKSFPFAGVTGTPEASAEGTATAIAKAANAAVSACFIISSDLLEVDWAGNLGIGWLRSGRYPPSGGGRHTNEGCRRAAGRLGRRGLEPARRPAGGPPAS